MEQKKTSGYLYDVGEGFPTRNGELKVIDRLRVVGKGDISRKNYMMECPAGHRYRVGNPI